MRPALFALIGGALAGAAAGCATTTDGAPPQANLQDATLPIGTPIADRDVDPGRTYVKPIVDISTGKPRADRLLFPGEGLAAKDGALHIVRPMTATLVATPSDTVGFPGTLIPVRLPSLGEVRVGSKVYFSSAPKDDLDAQRNGEWQEGTVDAVDPVFGVVKIGPVHVDGSKQILLPM